MLDAEGRARVVATIAYLRRCQAARAAGAEVGYVTDPAWLVEQAINRRGGYVEDPHARGSSPPIACGHGSSRRDPLYRKARGDWQRHLRLIAREVNTPRLVVRVERLGEHRWLAERLPHRFGDADALEGVAA